MESIKKIFKIGYGPSSSHTIGPRNAATIYKNKHLTTNRFRVTLYGALAATGKGHLTDQTISEALSPALVEFVWKPDTFLEFHPNAVLFETISSEGVPEDPWTIYSIGGGEISDGATSTDSYQPIYTLGTMGDILSWCKKNGRAFWEYVDEYEDKDIWDYLSEIWKVMQAAVERGLDSEGRLPGQLNLQRKAASYYVKAKSYNRSLKRRSLMFSYALAVSEENACGGEIVTAPTCGSCGVIPAVMYLLYKDFEFSDTKILRALATAGIIGNIIKKNASISGAQVGCQGEIGAACAMAAGAAAQVFGGSTSQIEYSAEMGLEHHLGLTCDPICGLVQIPCIERNAFAAARALDSSTYSILSDGRHIVTFDKIVRTMNQTGHDLPSIYKETSGGGLAIDC
jgi:L-serine dehydratase